MGADMERNQKKQTIAFAVGGALTIAAILIITTIWVSGRARDGTSQAVSKVSEFYLEELAGRRALVVSEELNNKFTYMENALGILGFEGEYLKSQETLRVFLGKVKKLYGVDKFALVDENGIVYTEHSTTSGLSRYSFLSEELTDLHGVGIGGGIGEHVVLHPRQYAQLPLHADAPGVGVLHHLPGELHVLVKRQGRSVDHDGGVAPRDGGHTGVHVFAVVQVEGHRDGAGLGVLLHRVGDVQSALLLVLQGALGKVHPAAHEGVGQIRPL